MYLCGASKARYIIAPSDRSDFEVIVAEYVYAPELFNAFKGGDRQILAKKTTAFDPMLLIDENASFKVVCILHPKSSFCDSSSKSISRRIQYRLYHRKGD